MLDHQLLLLFRTKKGSCRVHLTVNVLFHLMLNRCPVFLRTDTLIFLILSIIVMKNMPLNRTEPNLKKLISNIL